MLHQDFKDLISVLNTAKVDYLLVGGCAVAAHGYPRATQDLNIWLWANEENTPKIMQALSAFGVPESHIDPADFSNPNFILHMGIAPWRIDFLTHIPGLVFEEAYAAHILVAFEDVQTKHS